MTQFGAVLKFRRGVPKERIEYALGLLAGLLDTPETILKPVPEVQERLDRGETVRMRDGEWKEAPFELMDLLHEFDPEVGEPVWYIP